jgi:hypothetical protein
MDSFPGLEGSLLSILSRNDEKSNTLLLESEEVCFGKERKIPERDRGVSNTLEGGGRVYHGLYILSSASFTEELSPAFILS